MRESSASILCVGTELTSGELVNTNATVLARRLNSLGLDIAAQLTVPDEFDLILQGLQQCALWSDFIIVTGGLGPTKDDFTRDVIARWAGLSLEKNENSLQRIREIFVKAGRPFFEFQEQQVYFPAKAQVFENLAGTADGFALIHGKKPAIKCLVLPGPPREIDYIWRHGAEDFLRRHIHTKKNLSLRSWLCFGEGESRISQITETALAKAPFQTGYRAHAPYVEVKIWGRKEDLASHPQIQTLDRALRPYFISEKRETYAQRFLRKLADYGNSPEMAPDGAIILIDGVTRGERIAELNQWVNEHRRPFEKINLSLISDLTNTANAADDAGGSRSRRERWRSLADRPAFAVFPGTSPGEFSVMFSLKDPTLYFEKFCFPENLLRSKRYRALWAFEKGCQILADKLPKIKSAGTEPAPR